MLKPEIPEYIPSETGQYHGCWCLGSFCLQDISSLDIDYADKVVFIISPVPKDRGMLWFYVKAARRPQWC